MQAAHGSDIETYSQMYIYHVLGNKILPFNEKGISHVRKINKNNISSNTAVICIFFHLPLLPRCWWLWELYQYFSLK